MFEVTCPHCSETFEIEVPVAAARRGQLYGLSLEDMTDEQLKREIINAGSVLYKAKQRGATEATIEANQARVDAAKAERDKRKALKAAEEKEEAADEASDVYEAVEVDEEAAAEM